MRKNDYIRTDLASESDYFSSSERSKAEEKEEYSGIKCDKRSTGGIPIFELEVTSENGERIIGKKRGTYVTVDVGKVWLLDDAGFRAAACALSAEILRMASGIASLDNVLIAGLGNRYVTPDAVGPLTVKGIEVTRHIKDEEPGLYDSLFSTTVSAVEPGVVGQTGIETLELIRGAVQNVSPSLVIVIDALAARSVDRLASTVQLTNTGISPGSGIGNRRREISRDTLGVPVIAIGVPTIVDSSTMVWDMLERAGAEEMSSVLRDELENGRSFFVSLKESDVAVNELSRLISTALNKIFERKS